MGLDLRGMCPLLEVFDMATSLAFYCNVLGFKVRTHDGKPLPDVDWVWLQREDIHLMLNTAYEREYRPAAPDAKRVATHHDTTLYFSCPDVDAAYEFLKGRGAKITQPPKIAPYGMKQLYVTDPDGYNLCFQWSAKASGSTGKGSTA